MSTVVGSTLACKARISYLKFPVQASSTFIFKCIKFYYAFRNITKSKNIT